MLTRLALFLALCAALSPAALLRIELSERSDVDGGRAFGSAGPYVRLAGKAFFAVDPMLPANKIIADIEKAPRNKDGLVEYSADLYVLTPGDPAKGNGAALFEVSNRGGKGMLAMYNRAAGSTDPRTSAQLGDGFLMERGFTLVWLGWEFDVPPQEHLLRLYTPVARDGAKPITGLVRSEFIPDKPETSHSLGDRNQIPYPVLDPEDPKLTLTVRDRGDAARQPVDRKLWSIEDRGRVVMPSGFQPGKIYELVYTSQDPALVGLGPAGVRDVISFLKYGGNNATALGDHNKYIKRAYGFGVSQSGRFLRTFLYYGFNGDEKGRQVFDGVLSHVAGGGRGSFNHRFAQPSRDGHPFLNLFYPTDIFPFTDVEETDPATGMKDGLLTHANAPRPKIFYTNSSYEYWGRSASLIHTTIDGKGDAIIPDTTRIYSFAGGQHGPAGFPPATPTQTVNRVNHNDYRWSMRAFLVAMDRWVKEGAAPPVSQYPKVSDDNLVSLGALNFPKIPGVTLPQRPQRAWRADYGPRFRTEGIVTQEPPKIGQAFPILVPQVDTDGNETSGVRMPAIQVPLATYTGWNLRAPKLGAPQELFSMQGSWLPFARTKAEREAKRDPRPSIAERYRGREEYLTKVKAAALKLAGGGYLLQSDVAPVVERGAAEWDYLANGN